MKASFHELVERLRSSWIVRKELWELMSGSLRRSVMYPPMCVGHILVSLQCLCNTLGGVHLVPSNVESANCMEVI